MLLVIALVIILLSSNNVCAHEERSDGHFSFLNPEGNVFFQTAIRVSLGDEFIDEDNSHYRVARIEDDDVHCEYLGLATPRRQLVPLGMAAYPYLPGRYKL